MHLCVRVQVGMDMGCVLASLCGCGHGCDQQVRVDVGMGVYLRVRVDVESLQTLPTASNDLLREINDGVATVDPQRSQAG